MRITVFPDDASVARAAAAFVADMARAAVVERGQFTLAVSGGTTPWQMLRALGGEEIAWDAVHVFQVDERVAPAGDAQRNLTHLHESLLGHGMLRPAHIHAMPVEDDDLQAAARRYARALEEIAGAPAVLDLVHLGLGADGHTASLVPADPVLRVEGADVAVTAPYQGHRRMTLTYPALNRARLVLWLVTGAAKADMLARLRAADPAIPAGRIRAAHAVVFADQAAAARLAP